MELVIDKKIIETPIIDILHKLRSDLHSQGINKLNIVLDKGENARIQCIYHKDGQESHPSCGVKIREGIESRDRDVALGWVHCFTCGASVPFPVFISNCFGVFDNGEYGEEWLLNNCSVAYIASSWDRLTPITNETEETKKEIEYIKEEELDKYRYYHPYMYKRKLTDEIINKFDIGYDKERNLMTMPVWDENNNCVMVTGRSVGSKYFHLDADKEKPVYLYNYIKNENIDKDVYVCESQINALTLWTWGYHAIAMLGTGTTNQYKTLKESKVKNFILCFDGDSAGDKAITRFKKNINNKFIEVVKIPRNMDVNDLTKEEFDSLSRYNI